MWKFVACIWALLLLAPSAFAQSGWERAGSGIADMMTPADPAVPIIAVSIDGRAGSKIYADCLFENTQKYGATANDPNEAVRAAFSACVQERQIFYSAVYGDVRKKEREKSAIQISNGVLENFDKESFRALPRFAIEAAAKNETAAQPSQDKYDQIGKLKSLLDSGAISQIEFDQEKAKILSAD